MTYRSILISIASVSATILSPSANGAVKLPAIFGDHMVLQQEAKLPVWGTAEPGEDVTVTVGDHMGKTTAEPDGKWRVDLAPFPNGAAATTMTVTGKNTVTFQDVVIGDVWLASGQSNMWYSAEGAATQRSYPAQVAAVPRGGTDENIRLFLVSEKTAVEPATELLSPSFWVQWDGKNHQESEDDHPGRWVLAEAHNVHEFSAIAYFFGKALETHLNRPIGLVGSYWPGSLAEAWTSIPGLEKNPPFTTYLEAHKKNAAQYPTLEPAYEKARAAYLADLKKYEDGVQANNDKFNAAMQAWQDTCKKAQAAGQPNPPQPQEQPFTMQRPHSAALPTGDFNQPGNLYNAMIAPLIPYAIKGVIWYQGESNTQIKAPEYRILFPRMITDWREKWDQGDFPFLYVQISHNAYLQDTSCALVREAQVATLSLPKTGMAVTVDIPCDEAIHPADKLDPAERLVLAARHVAYGENLIFSGPLYQSYKVENGAVRVSFSSVGSGLKIGAPPYQPPTFGNTPIIPNPTNKLLGFTIAGDDQKFVPADAKIEGATVVVSSPDVPKPTAVRFAWADTVTCDNLYNSENLPASPFRTDHWTNFRLQPFGPDVAPPTFGLEVLGIASTNKGVPHP